MKKKSTVFIILFSLMISCGCGDMGVTNLAKHLCRKRVSASDILVNPKMIMYGDGQKALREADIEWGADEFVDVMNVGWNLGASLGSSAQECGYDANLDLETKWGNPKVTKELIDYVSSLGFNTIRIPVSWCYNCGRDEKGHLQVGKEWMKRVHEVVDYAIYNGMYVILNTMCDSWELFFCGVENEEEWLRIQQDTIDLWSQIANDFKDYDEHLLFESYNEVDNIIQGFTYSDLAAQQMNTLNQIFVDTVRMTGGNNPNRILIIPTLFDGKKSNITTAFKLPKDSVNNKLIVTVHCYEQEYDQDIEWIFQSIEDFSKRNGVPILIGEFGARDDYSLIEWRNEFTSNYIARATSHGIKCCIWDDGHHWKIIDRHNFDDSNLELIQSIFKGLEGQAYETNPEEKIVFDSMEDFYFGGMDLETGMVSLVDYQSVYWASLTTKSAENSPLKIGYGDRIVISMTAKNQAAEFWIYGIAFFNRDNEPIAYKVSKNILHKFLCAKIPDEAVYYAVNTYDPYNNHSLEQINDYFKRGDLKITVTFINSNDNNLNMTQLY